MKMTHQVGKLYRKIIDFVRSHRLAVASAALVVLIAVALSVLYMHRSTDITVTTQTSSQVCTDAMLVSARDAMHSNDTNSLGDVVATIYTKSGYDQDINCLYIVNQYGVMVGNIGQATIDAFATQYKSNQLSKVFKVSNDELAAQQHAWKVQVEKQGSASFSTGCDAVGCTDKENQSGAN